MTFSQSASLIRTSPRQFLAGFLFVLAAVGAFGAPLKFDLPAQQAPDALRLFMKQSGAQVAFSADDLKDVTTNAVSGEFEPAAALDLLLKETGFSATPRPPDWFIVARTNTPAEKTGAIKGSLVEEGGIGFARVLVVVRETGQSAITDKNGQYVFPNVAAGTYVIVATAPGYQPMHITDVVVRAGRELTLGKEELRKAHEGVMALEPLIVHANAVEELEKIEVTGTRQKPFTTASRLLAYD